MSRAEKVYRKFQTTCREDEGESFRGWAARKNLEWIDCEICEDSHGSYDPSVIITFRDKSRIRVDNPDQAAFNSSISVM